MKVKNTAWLKPALLAVVLVSAGSLGVAAANSGDWGHGDHGRCTRGDYGEHGRFMSRAHRFDPGRHIDGVLAYIKAELKITADQEQAWQKFADVVRSDAKVRVAAWQAHREAWKQQARAQSQAKLPTVPERLDSRLQAMERRTEGFKKMAEAAKALYAQLTPEQQGTADHMLMRHHDRRPGF